MSQYIEILKSKPHDIRQLRRYITFIQKCKELNVNEKNLVAHHICPEASDMFQEYGSFKLHPWNKVLLTERQHYIAHMILWKVYRNKSMTFAFNMMSNFQNIHFTSRLYEKHREDFRKYISEQNSRQRTEEEKKKASEKFKNSLVVYDIRDIEKNKFWIKKDDEKFDSEYYVYYRTGTKHSKETKMKIGKPGKRYCYNPKNNEIKIIYEDKLPNGFIWGYPPGVYKAEHVRDTIWCHHPETKEHLRVYENNIPHGFIKGRFMSDNPGIDKANSMTNIVDLMQRKVDKVFEIDKSIHGPESGTSSANTLIFIFGSKIFTSKKKLIDFLRSTGYYIEIGRNVSADLIEDIKVKVPHYNCKDEVNTFRKKYQGKTYRDLGLSVIKLELFDISKHPEKEIYWGD